MGSAAAESCCSADTLHRADQRQPAAASAGYGKGRAQQDSLSCVFEGILEAPPDSNAYAVSWPSKAVVCGYGVGSSRELLLS
jgi:hypothetical protein